MKKEAGRDTQIVSFDFIRVKRPKNISVERPSEETKSNILKYKPSNKPSAPRNSRTIVNKPNFSIPNLLNSFFICGLIK